MRTKCHITTFILALTLLVNGPANSGTLRKEVKKEVDFKAGGLVSLENINGDVRVETWDKDRAVIIAEIEVKSSSHEAATEMLDKVNIRVEPEGERLTIVSDYPRRRDGGVLDYLFGKHVSVSVKYILTLPRESDLHVENVNGNVTVQDVHGDLSLSSTNGDVVAGKVSGNVRVHTTNGRVEVTFVSLDPGNEISLKSTNGSILVSLPDGIGADVRAGTTNGSISTDFPLKVQGRYNSKRVQGTLGEGGCLIDLRTTNGSITLERGR